MPMPLSPTRLFVCTACGAVLPIGDELVGKQCRCGRCGKVSLIADESTSPPAESSSGSAAAPAPARRFSFGCRVCDTRLSARVTDVGRKAKCPDCGGLTQVPPPRQPRPRNVPQAMHGQQYSLWGVDEAPNPREMAARQPKFFPVYCRVCDTLMHARPAQVGQQLACPDCGAATVVRPPPPPPQKKSALVPAGEEYQLDATHVPPTRPQLQFERRPPAVEASPDEPIRTERRERPKLPRVPILQGVTPMLVRNPVVAWWFGLSGLGLTAGGFMLAVVSINPIAAIPFLIAAGVSAILALCATAAICLAVLTESSEGNDRLYNPPGPMFLDWIGDVVYLVTSGMLALAPWWLLCRVLEKDLSLVQQGMVQASGWLFTFPLLLLSCLENGSPLELFSPRIIGSLSKRPGLWLLLVMESVVLVGGCLVAVAGLLAVNPWLAFLAVPLCVATVLLYFRILGRFAWWLAESLATSEQEATAA